MDKFLVIEGTDGSGKTEVSKRLVEKINGNYFFTPPEGYEKIKEYINNVASPEARFLYYLSSVVDVSDKINKSNEKKDSICARYIWSTLVYYSVIENRDLKDVKEMIRPFEGYIKKPTKNILLIVSEEEQIRRINQRNGNKHTATDKLSVEQEEFRRKINEAYKNISEKDDSWIKIDTTNKSIDCIVNEIIKECNLGGQNGSRS